MKVEEDKNNKDELDLTDGELENVSGGGGKMDEPFMGQSPTYTNSDLIQDVANYLDADGSAGGNFGTYTTLMAEALEACEDGGMTWEDDGDDVIKFMGAYIAEMVVPGAGGTVWNAAWETGELIEHVTDFDEDGQGIGGETGDKVGDSFSQLALDPFDEHGDKSNWDNEQKHLEKMIKEDEFEPAHLPQTDEAHEAEQRLYDEIAKEEGGTPRTTDHEIDIPKPESKPPNYGTPFYRPAPREIGGTGTHGETEPID